MPFVPFCYPGWVVKLDWGTCKLMADDKVVYDADTGYVLLDQGRRHYENSKFRLYGCNAFEINDPDPAKRAKAVAGRDWFRSQVLGKQVCVRSMKYEEKFGRILTILWLNEANFLDNSKSLNRQLIDLGHAVPFMGELL